MGSRQVSQVIRRVLQLFHFSERQHLTSETRAEPKPDASASDVGPTLRVGAERSVTSAVGVYDTAEFKLPEKTVRVADDARRSQPAPAAGWRGRLARTEGPSGLDERTAPTSPGGSPRPLRWNPAL